jgi:tRNA threonylcarbamoyladenosine biosynthesis protein TsaB
VLLLGLDTATSAVTVALHDGGRVLAQLVTVDAHRHTELLAPAVEKVIADAGATPRDLTGIVAGVGPGPFTGLRVGLVTARVLGAALGIPVHGLCTLDAIAADAAALDDGKAQGQDGLPNGAGAAPHLEAGFLVATDARRREVYWARYDRAGRRLSGPEVSRPADIPVSGLPVAGEGPLLYPGLLPHGFGPARPSAATLGRLAAAALEAGDPDQLLLAPEPLYLRRPDAREPGAPKRVTP